MSKAKCWVFTCNNPQNLPKWNEKLMQYLLYVGQRGDEKKVFHHQGYIQYKCAQTHKLAMGHLQYSVKFFMEKAYGTDQHSHDYIFETKKELKGEKVTNVWKKPKEFGVRLGDPGWTSKQGERNDLLEVMEESKKKRKYELMLMYPTAMAKYGKFIDDFKLQHRLSHLKDPVYPIVCKWFRIEKPDEKMKKRHWLIIGSSTVGKTRIKNEVFKEIRMFPVGMGKSFRYGHYDDEDIIVFDDVDDVCEKEIIEISDVHWHGKERYGGGQKNVTGAIWGIGHVRVIVMLIMPQDIKKWMYDDWFVNRFETVIIN